MKTLNRRLNAELDACLARQPEAQERLDAARQTLDTAAAELKKARAALDAAQSAACTTLPADNVAAWKMYAPLHARLHEASDQFGKALEAERAADRAFSEHRTQLWQLNRKIALLNGPAHREYVSAIQTAFERWSERMDIDKTVASKRAKVEHQHALAVAELVPKRCPICLADILSGKVLSAPEYAPLKEFKPKATQCACVYHCRCLDSWVRTLDQAGKPITCPCCRTPQVDENAAVIVPTITRYGRVSRPPSQPTSTQSCADSLRTDEELYSAIFTTTNG